MSAISLPQTKIPFWRTLRWNLILVFVLLAVVPVALVGYFTIAQMKNQATQQVVNQLKTTATLKEGQIRRWLQTSQLALDVLLSNLDIKERFASYIETPQPDSREQLALNVALKDVVDTQATGAPILRELFIYDVSGRILIASNPDQIGKIVSRQPYFADSLKGNFTQSPYYEVGTGELTMFRTRLLTDKLGRQLGVLAGRLDLSSLGQIMTERAGLGETGETYLVSQENNYLLTPSHFDGYPINQAYHSEGINRALQGVSGFGNYDDYRSPAVPVIGYYTWIPELKAALLAEVDEHEAYLPFYQTSALSTIVAVIAALVAVGVGFAGASSISRPIVQLTSLASRIAAGDFTQRANVYHRNETGVLAQAFNQMTDQLSQNIRALDQKIDEVQKVNKALQLATQQAQESVRLKSEFMSTMSHELRTPLNAILGFCGIMLEGMGGEIDTEAAGMLERIQSNSQRLLKLINEVLDLAKIEAGRMELSVQLVSPTALASQWKSQMHVLAEQKGLQFAVEVDPELPEKLYCDPDRVTQIAINLLSNAFKFTEKGSVRLSLESAGEQWLIRVADTGIGIPPHAINYIFDEFRQVDGSSKRVYGGTGLGLAIVRNLSMMMNGNVQVTSELGRGSTFTVSLPLKDTPERVQARFLEAV
jgi:two-component system sensor kinase